MNKKLLVVGAAMLSICMTACSQPAIESSSTASSEEETVYDLKNEDLPKGVTTFQAEDGTTHNLNRASIYKAVGDPHVNSCPEDGKKQKLLVNPIRFQKDEGDSRASTSTGRFFPSCFCFS